MENLARVPCYSPICGLLGQQMKPTLAFQPCASSASGWAWSIKICRSCSRSWGLIEHLLFVIFLRCSSSGVGREMFGHALHFSPTPYLSSSALTSASAAALSSPKRSCVAFPVSCTSNLAILSSFFSLSISKICLSTAS